MLFTLALALTLSASAQPIITTLVPTAAAAGAVVTISGSGFAPTPAQNAVYFGIGRATVTAATTSQLTVRVPTGASSVAPVTVTNLATRQLGSSLTSATPFFTVTFAGPGLNAASYRPVSYPLSTSRSGLSALATADFNADDYPDFAVVADNNLYLLLSDGLGGYDPALALDAGTAYPAYVKVADVDANGTPDLLVAGKSGLVLLRNLGNGNGFTTALPIDLGGPRQLGDGFFSIDVQDMNADGRPDLILPVSSPNAAYGLFQLIELRNNGAGFNTPTVLLSDQLQGQVVADFTGDGKPDILTQIQVIASTITFQLRLLARNATNTGYETSVTLPTTPGKIAGGALLLADVNADGQPDLVTTAQLGGGQNGIMELLHATGGFTTLGPFGLTPASALDFPYPWHIADLDGNGWPDVLAFAASKFAVLPGVAGGGLGTPLTFGPAGQLVTGDFDRDGRTDVAAFNVGTGSLIIYYYTGANSITNNPPTLNPLADLTLDEDAPQQNIALSGISNGGEPGQAVTITAVSSDPALIPNPTIAYFSPTSTGTLRLKPAPDAFGTCIITVTASDGQAQNGTITRSFRVTVNPVNDAPTLDPIPDVVATTATNGIIQTSIPLSGITSGAANENQLLTLSVSFIRNDPNLSGGFSSTITYTSPATTGQLDFVLVLGNNTPPFVGTMTVTVNDGQLTNNTLNRTFRVYYNPGGTSPNIPSRPPTLDAIADLTANRSLATQLPVALTGITDGDPSQVLPLTVTAVSSDPDLVSVGTPGYTSPATTGTLPYTISSTRSGTATVSVTVSNGQPQNGSILRSFRVTVPGAAVVTATSGAAGSPTFSLYPNPAPGGHFTVTSPGAAALDVTVLDLTGREVLTQRLTAGQQALALPAGTAQGVYLVRVRTSQGTATRRLLVE